MSIERTYWCDGPECNDGHPCHATTATPPPHLPSGIIEVRTRDDGVDDTHHFCGWGCVMRYAAAQPEPTIIPWGDIEP